MKPAVALVAHGIHDQGGMERVCAELLRRTHNEFDFTVVSAELAPSLRPLVHRWIRIRVPAKPIPLKSALFWVCAGRALMDVKANVIHTVGAIVPNRADIVAVHFCTAGFVHVQGLLGSPATPLLRRANTAVAHLLSLAFEQWCYRPGRAQAFAAVSDGVRDELLQHYPGVYVQVTPNGVDLSRFHPDASTRADLRRNAGLADEPVAVFIGSDWDRKGLDLAMHALAEARGQGVDLRLWVVGAGDHARFSTLARELGVGSAVSFFGVRGDVERFLAAADVFLLPSMYEAFSLVTLEAAATGLPMIVPAINGASELVGNNEAGLLVERTGESIAAALARVVGDTDLRSRLGRQARRRAAHYTWDRSVEAVTRLYSAVLVDEMPLGR